MNIAITGATGFVGSHLAEYFVNQGHAVTCLVRKTSKLNYLEKLDVSKIVGDMTFPETLSTFIKNQDIIIHSAGLTKARNENEYVEANAKSTENLLKTLKTYHQSIKRFILISSQAAVGPSQNREQLNETATLNPITAYGRSKAKAEKIALEFAQKLPITIIRPPAVYGPRDVDIFTYFKLIKKGMKPIIGYENTVSMVYVKNLVYSIGLAMNQSAAVGQTYNITDDGMYTWGELADMIAYALNKNPIKIKIPSWTVVLIASFNAIYSTIFKKAVLLNRDKLLEMKQPYWLISNEKAKNEINYNPKYSTKDAIKETALWYEENSWL
jgi:nucleoside-diphosphate-sugar epimerase